MTNYTLYRVGNKTHTLCNFDMHVHVSQFCQVNWPTISHVYIPKSLMQPGVVYMYLLSELQNLESYTFTITHELEMSVGFLILGKIMQRRIQKV
jgi:hypothetical protein